jgi:hypothetical protein
VDPERGRQVAWQAAADAAAFGRLQAACDEPPFLGEALVQQAERTWRTWRRREAAGGLRQVYLCAYVQSYLAQHYRTPPPCLRGGCRIH